MVGSGNIQIIGSRSLYHPIRDGILTLIKWLAVVKFGLLGAGHSTVSSCQRRYSHTNQMVGCSDIQIIGSRSLYHPIRGGILTLIKWLAVVTFRSLGAGHYVVLPEAVFSHSSNGWLW